MALAYNVFSRPMGNAVHAEFTDTSKTKPRRMPWITQRLNCLGLARALPTLAQCKILIFISFLLFHFCNAFVL
jgi:hypothetical protein